MTDNTQGTNTVNSASETSTSDLKDDFFTFQFPPTDNDCVCSKPFHIEPFDNSCCAVYKESNSEHCE